MGRKRRGSQAFSFDQSEETLAQNETIVNLYKNKIFIPPEAKLYETIFEEGEKPTNQRSKRGASVSNDGTLVLGANKLSRQITTYKFWKQDDKDRNRKRKSMITKLWKGRKRLKISPLEPAGEQKLIDLIADRVSSDEEDDVSSPKKIKINSNPAQNCVWDLVDPSCNPSRIAESTSSSDIDYRSNCVWSQRNSNPEELSSGAVDNSDVRVSLTCDNANEPTDNDSEVFEHPPGDTNDKYSETILELEHLIPKSELDELLQTDDLLFCAETQKSSKSRVLGSITNLPAAQDPKQKEHRKSLRRSARLGSIPNIVGSIYTTDEETSPNKNLRRHRKQAPSISVDTAEAVEDASKANDANKVQDVSSNSLRKKRRSYSLEDGSRRYSLDGSRKNSMLTVTGDMEINISLPESVRRSFSAEIVQFSRTPLISPSPKKSKDLSKDDTKEYNGEDDTKENDVHGKVALPVPKFADTDSEEDEVLISGIFGRKTLKSKVKSRRCLARS